MAKKKKVSLAFMDLQKAYDSINRETLWKKMAALGFGGQFKNTIIFGSRETVSYGMAQFFSPGTLPFPNDEHIPPILLNKFSYQLLLG